MGVAPGSPVSAANTNQAFIDANADDVGVGIVGLANTNTASGAAVNSLQREHNATASFTGMPLNSVKNILPAWTSNDVGASSDPLKTRADLLSAKFNPSTGHKHTGAAGDAPNVSSVDLINVVLRGYFTRGVDKTGITGSTMDVSSDFTLKVASPNSSVKGVVVTAPQNKIMVRQASGVDTGDDFIDGSGNLVYARLTNSGATWTVSFYVLISGTETVYSFGSSVDVAYYYQELFNPIVDAPVYSELAVIPSDNVADEVPAASETVAGKVLLSNVVAQPVGSANVKGTSGRTPHDDHAHEGVHSIGIDGDITQLLGDVKMSPGTGITLSIVSGKVKIDSTGGTVGFQEVPSNPVNGVNTTFGPLTHTAVDGNSILVYVDVVPQILGVDYTVASNTVTMTTAPVAGQKVYIFYLISGVLPAPPVVSGALKTEFRTITSGEAAAKKIIMVQTPASPGDVLVDIIAGGPQQFNVDYTVVGNEFRWTGYALDGVLAQNDVVRIHYIY